MGQSNSKRKKHGKKVNAIPDHISCDHRHYSKLINMKKIAPFSEGEEEVEGKIQEECYICCHMFEEGLNRCMQCQQGICTYCYIRMMPYKYDKTPCPYCKDQPWMVKFTGVRKRTAEEILNEKITEEAQAIKFANMLEEQRKREELVKKQRIIDREREAQQRQVQPPETRPAPVVERETRSHIGTQNLQLLRNEGINERTVNMLEHHVPQDMVGTLTGSAQFEEQLLQRAISMSMEDNRLNQLQPPASQESRLNPNDPNYDEEYATQYFIQCSQEEAQQQVQHVTLQQTRERETARQLFEYGNEEFETQQNQHFIQYSQGEVQQQIERQIARQQEIESEIEIVQCVDPEDIEETHVEPLPTSPRINTNQPCQTNNPFHEPTTQEKIVKTQRLDKKVEEKNANNQPLASHPFLKFTNSVEAILSMLDGEHEIPKLALNKMIESEDGHSTTLVTPSSTCFSGSTSTEENVDQSTPKSHRSPYKKTSSVQNIRRRSSL